MNKTRINNTNSYLVHVNDNTTVLLSYKTPVAALVDGVYIRTKQYYSVTTTKHINRFVGNYSNAEQVEQSVLDSLVK